MLVIVSSATAAPGRRDELVAAARAVAAATRSDHGCLAYAFSADLDDPDRILGLEADQRALDAHMSHVAVGQQRHHPAGNPHLTPGRVARAGRLNAFRS